MTGDTNGSLIRDIDIPFGRLVLIFIKMFLAMIPALIVLYIIVTAIVLVVAGVLGGFGMMPGGMPHWGG